MTSSSRTAQQHRRAWRITALAAITSVIGAMTTLVGPALTASAAPSPAPSAKPAQAQAATKGTPATAFQKQTRASTKLDPKLQTSTGAVSPNAAPNPDGTYNETAGGVAHTWTNYTNAGGSQGPSVGNGQTIEIACVVQGFRVADGNTSWYQIAQSPWSYVYYVSADAFYNNGQTSGSLVGTPFVDPSVPPCGSGGYPETAGGAANTWTNYTNAGGSQGPTIGGGSAVRMACKVQGFKVQDGNVWWYRIQDQPWNNQYYVSADAFYNNGQTSGSLLGTPFVDPNVPDCSTGSTGPPPTPGTNETAGGAANTWTDYTHAGGTQGPTVAGGQTIVIACKIQGFRVADGNTYWYRIAQSPWNGAYYASADAFYNNGQTSGSLRGTPFYDPAVPDCTGSNPGGTDPSTTPPGGVNETAGGVAHTWTNYTNAGGTEGPDVGGGQTVLIACKMSGFQVADGNTWWYLIASGPWNGSYYVSADAFYNNGHTSGSLIGTPFVDYTVADCSTQSGGGSSPSSGHPSSETAGGVADTFGNYSHAGVPGPNQVPGGATVQVTCRAQGFRVADGNTWWYLIASSPWNNVWYVSADAFYNNGATSGSLAGTPFYDPSVPVCVNNSEAPLYGTSYGSAHSTTHTTSCGAADPVNCGSGNFSHSFTDILITGRGPGIDVTRTYNSLNSAPGGLFGNGWSSTYDQLLNTDSPTRAADGSIVLGLEDGSQVTATPNGSGFSTPAATDTTFVANADGTYTLTRHETLIETFSAAGQLVSIGDLNGYKTMLTYDSSHHLSAITDASGRAATIVVGSNGLVASATDPLGRTTTYMYDASNNLVTTTDPLGLAWKFTYDSNNRMLTMTDPRGGVVTNTYQSGGRVNKQVDAADMATTFSYTGDNFGSLGGTTTITDPHGNIRVEQYANGFLTQVTKAYGTPAQAIWTYQYDPGTYGRTQVTDPKGNATHSTYDAHGRALTITDATGATTTYAYNALGEVTSTQTPLHETSSKTYDSAGNLLTATDALGNSTSYTYGDGSHPGDLTAITDPDGRTTQYAYDTHGDVASHTTTPASGTTDTATYSYDVNGEQVCRTSPNATAQGIACPTPGSPRTAGTTTHAYDATGRPTAVTDPKGHTTTTSYDANGNVTSVTNPDSHTTSTSYDANNRKLTVTVGANGSSPSTTSYAYDVAPGTGACSAVSGATYCQTTTDGNGTVTANYFDARGNQIEEQRPASLVTTYTYDLDDNMLTKIDAAGRTTTYGYDTDNRLTSTIYSDGSTPNVAYSYDADGHRKATTDGTGTTTYNYDFDGRTSAVTSGTGATVGYAYDRQGDVTAIMYPNGHGVTRSYDGAHRLVTVSDWLGHTTAYTYDADGNPITIAYPNGDTATSSYDSSDALATTGVSAPANPLLSLAYSRDPAGLITAEARTGALSGTTRYGYNAKDQLVKAGSDNFAYDLAGNMTANSTTTQVYNATDELTASTVQAATTTYAYDPVGHQTSATQPSGASTTYTYDQAGRLTSVARVIPTPVVTAVAPSSGQAKGGTTVTVTGTGFTGATTVAFGALAATSYKVVSDTKITAVAPAEAAGIVDLEVTTPGGASVAAAADRFTYLGAPSVTGVAPSSGPTTGGTTVTITGTGFTGATKVAFGSAVATSLTVVSDTQLTAVTSAQPVGARNTFITTPGGTSAAVTADIFTYAAGPTITAVAPTSGPSKGGTTVTVTGTGFTGATRVAFGPLAATSYKVVSDTKITAAAPAQAVGIVDIEVTSPNGTSPAVSADGFTYAAPPSVTRVAPSSGSTAGGTTVTITGSGLTGATKVVFGPLAATGVTVVSDTQLTAVSPAQLASVRHISVTTPGGASRLVAADRFTYVVPSAAKPWALRTDAAPSESGAPTIFRYNGDGLRMSETTATAIVAFTWDGTTAVPQLLSDANYFYIYGSGGIPIEQVDARNTPTYFFHDVIGSTRALLTSTGSVGAAITYAPYGKIATQTGTATTPLLFARSYTDLATGLDYLVNRYYNAGTGQFNTVDPALSQTAAPYNYAGDNPINATDPSGLWWNEVDHLAAQLPVVGNIYGFVSGGIQTLGAYASTVGTCFGYGWSSNECSNATWNATISNLSWGLQTLAGPHEGIATWLNGGDYVYKASGGWQPYPESTSTPSAGAGSSGGGSLGSGCGPVNQAWPGSGDYLQPASAQIQGLTYSIQGSSMVLQGGSITLQ